MVAAVKIEPPLSASKQHHQKRMADHQIITLQLGSYANFVGSHYWNIQDELLGCGDVPEWSTLAPTVSSEVVCSWSEDRYGDASYVPRTVVVDLSGSLGGVSFGRAACGTDATAAAAAVATHSGLWDGGVQLQQAPSIAKSKYRQQLEDAGRLQADLDDPDQLELQQQALEAAAAELHAETTTPRYWTDFLQVDLADSCVLTLSGSWQGQMGWDGWGVPGSSSGSAVRELVDAAVDRVRWWAEQCDRMQGLQLLADDLGGWGGICHDVLQQLRDQYPTQPVLYFSLRQQQQQTAAATSPGAGLNPAQIRRLLSSSLALCEMPQLASLFVPLDAGGHSSAAGTHTSSSFQSAALLAAAIDTVTLPLRCSGSRSTVGAALGPTDLHSLVNLLSGPAANLAAASLQLPAASLPSSTGPASSPAAANGSAASSSGSSSAEAFSLGGARCSSLSPGVQLNPDQCLAESVVLRGARASPAAALSSVAATKQALDALLLRRQAESVACRCVVHACVSPVPLAAPLSFPRALLPTPVAARVQAGGGAGAAPDPYLPRSVNAPSVPAPGVFSRLTATSGFEGVLKGAARDLTRLGGHAAGRAALEEWGYSASDLEELNENLLEMAGKYAVDFD